MKWFKLVFYVTGVLLGVAVASDALCSLFYQSRSPSPGLACCIYTFILVEIFIIRPLDKRNEMD